LTTTKLSNSHLSELVFFQKRVLTKTWSNNKLTINRANW